MVSIFSLKSTSFKTSFKAPTVPRFFVGMQMHLQLVGGDWNIWNMTFLFPHIMGIRIPIDEVIFFQRGGSPPTRKQIHRFFIGYP